MSGVRGPVIAVDAARVVHEEIDGEVIAIDLSTGAYFSLRGVAADTWRLLAAGPVEPDYLIEALADRYGEAPDLSDEVLGFVADLQSQGLVSASEAEPARPDLDGGHTPPYEPPRFEKYTDMQELILLDPVHEVDAAGWPVPAPPTD